MALSLPTFPTLSGLVFPVLRSPNWLTDTQKTVTGKRSALQNYTYPIWDYELGFSFLRSDSVNLEWQTLVTFFNRNYGSAGVWQFTDPDDTTATAQQFGTGDSLTTAYQLIRKMTGTGANQFTEPVYAPIGNPSIYINGVLTAARTVSDTGLVTFNAAPASGTTLTWTGTYNWLCRFDKDNLGFSKFAQNFWELGKVAFSSEKL